MKLTATRSNLLSALSRCLPLAKTRSTMPALSCVLIRADLMQPISLSATNLMQAVTTRAPADVSEAGVSLIDARDLDARVKSFPEGPITVELVALHLHLVAGKRKHRIPALPAEEFPSIAPAPTGGVQLPGQVVSDVLEQASPAASEDADRINLHAVHLEFLSGELQASATDGRRVYQATQPAPGLAASPPILIPLGAIDGILSSLDKASPVTVGRSSLEFGLISGETTFTTKLVENTFPPLADFWARKPADAFSVDPAALADAMNSVALGSKDGDLRGLLTFTLEDGDLLISAQGKGAASSAVPITPLSGLAPFKFSALLPLLSPFLRSLPSLVVSLTPDDPLSPIYLHGPHSRAIVMPCR